MSLPQVSSPPTDTSTLVPKSLVDAKGDIFVGTADDTVARKAVGTNGKVLAADSAQSDGLAWSTPNAAWNPASHGLLTASYDPVAAVSGSINFSAAFIVVARMPLQYAVTVTNLIVYIVTGSGALTFAKGLLYKLDGTLIAQTASQTTGWSTSGLKTMPLTAESGQSLALPAADVIAGFMTEGASPAVKGAVNLESTIMTVGQSSPALRGGFVDPAGTATVPTTLSGLAADTKMVWAALN